jgi:hypothetical protein
MERTLLPNFITLCSNKLNSLQRYDTAQKDRLLHSAPCPDLKALSSKLMIQVKLVDMSMIFYCISIHLSKCNDSPAVSKK